MFSDYFHPRCVTLSCKSSLGERLKHFAFSWVRSSWRHEIHTHSWHIVREERQLFTLLTSIHHWFSNCNNFQVTERNMYSSLKHIVATNKLPLNIPTFESDEKLRRKLPHKSHDVCKCHKLVGTNETMFVFYKTLNYNRPTKPSPDYYVQNSFYPCRYTFRSIN